MIDDEEYAVQDKCKSLCDIKIWFCSMRSIKKKLIISEERGSAKKGWPFSRILLILRGENQVRLLQRFSF